VSYTPNPHNKKPIQSYLDSLDNTQEEEKKTQNSLKRATAGHQSIKDLPNGSMSTGVSFYTFKGTLDELKNQTVLPELLDTDFVSAKTIVFGTKTKTIHSNLPIDVSFSLKGQPTNTTFISTKINSPLNRKIKSGKPQEYGQTKMSAIVPGRVYSTMPIEFKLFERAQDVDMSVVNDWRGFSIESLNDSILKIDGDRCYVRNTAKKPSMIVEMINAHKEEGLYEPVDDMLEDEYEHQPAVQLATQDAQWAVKYIQEAWNQTDFIDLSKVSGSLTPLPGLTWADYIEEGDKDKKYYISISIENQYMVVNSNDEEMGEEDDEQ
jgi:hypothetical protein